MTSSPPPAVRDWPLVEELAAAAGGLATIAVARPDGTVHASLVNAGPIDHPTEHIAAIAFVVRPDAAKLRLLRAGRPATITFVHGWHWVAVEGIPTVFGPDDQPAHDLATLLRTTYQAAGGTHDDWPTYDRVVAEERRAVVVLSPTRTLTTRRY